MTYASLHPGPKCRAVANLRGEPITCDLFADHAPLAHQSREHELLWAERGSDQDVEEA